MIEFLQPLVDAVSKALPAIAKHKERTSASKLGSELFLIYVQFNEALVLAEDIVSSLEVYVQRMTRHLETGEDKYALTGASWVSGKIIRQLENLAEIKGRMDQWRWELQILDGRSNNELNFLLDAKFSALNALAKTINAHRFPLRGNGIMIDDNGLIQAYDRRSARIQHRRLGNELISSSVPMVGPWGPDVLESINHYLSARKPREKLSEIRSSLEEIRAALEKNFTISDILLQAGDPRARRRGRY